VKFGHFLGMIEILNRHFAFGSYVATKGRMPAFLLYQKEKTRRITYGAYHRFLLPDAMRGLEEGNFWIIYLDVMASFLG